MFFIFPMWDSESQRMGKHKCTRLGYALHGAAELLGFIGLLLLFAAVIYLGYRALHGTFHASLLWVLAVPFSLGSIGEILYRHSWKLAARRGFEYDYEKREARWLEGTQRRFYKWDA